MTPDDRGASIDERTILVIAERVAEALRSELQTIAADLTATEAPDRPLTVGQVADRFGVARSTVYAHWRDWGGYKLGLGDRAAIRFPPTTLPDASPKTSEPSKSAGPETGRSRRRRDRPVLRGAPRMPSELGDATPNARYPDDS